jgi:hypothetical protein
MTLETIVSHIDSEIATLQQVRSLLAGGSSVSAQELIRKAAPMTASPKKRTMSAEGRARIAAAQKRRWAALKKAAK